MAQPNGGESGKQDSFNPIAIHADESVGSVTGERWVGMSSGALVGVAAGAGPTEDRIDVTDDQGRRIGWVDPRTGARTLLEADRAAEFDEMVDFWLFAAGLSDTPGVESDGLRKESEAGAPLRMHITEVRYPDPEVVRSLMIPLFHLR
ncbi:MAG TPA: hypothetical protein VMT88_14005 [Actinomycetes bacterium]|nr:hypothetical protein [Actinomycetes bacterium]